MEEYLKTKDENEKKKYLKKIKGLASPVADAAKQLCHTILRYEGNKQSRTKQNAYNKKIFTNVLFYKVI